MREMWEEKRNNKEIWNASMQTVLQRSGGRNGVQKI